ncbi:aspartyl protease family protein [Colwellia sp. MB02u-6]|uniref:aspartyl protease family protein n=1 Tax=Colwellia sp. MB02u-6 TaxID=2759824 RepID=UPI0015F57210|nr:aspartyl protease family protein [Colwellia sp. MB02u-6]MBA6328873.1 aspartyl protease family protein [Colwellia sp. MB02u-6]
MFKLRYLCLRFLCLSFLCFFSLLSFSGVTEWIDFKLVDGHVKIPVIVSGIDGYAILDTGAQVNSINSAFMQKNGLEFSTGRKVKVQGVYDTKTRKTYNNVPVNLLGAGFFSKFVVQLDYPKKKIRLINHDAINLQKLANVKMQFDKYSRQPIVNVRLNNENTVWLVLDTGNSGGLMLKRTTVQHFDWLSKFEIKDGISNGVNASGIHQVFRLPVIKIGPYELENVLTNVPGKNQSANLSSQGRQLGSRMKGKNIKGLLGYDVLKHFIVTLDYQGGHMHIVAP